MGQVRPRSHSHPVSQKVGRFGKVSQYSLALSPPKHVGGGGGAPNPPKTNPPHKGGGGGGGGAKSPRINISLQIPASVTAVSAAHLT